MCREHAIFIEPSQCSSSARIHNLRQESSVAYSVVHTFEQDIRPIFVLYGDDSNVEDIMSGFQTYLRECERILYLPLNMEQGKHDTPEETYFEVVQQLLNALLDVITDHDDQTRLSSLFRMIWNVRKNTSNHEGERQLAEFIRFTQHACYPILHRTFCHTQHTIVIGLEQFEHVAMWSSKLYNVILENFLGTLTEIPLRFVLFVRSEQKPDLFYGSNEEGSKERVVFYKVPMIDGLP